MIECNKINKNQFLDCTGHACERIICTLKGLLYSTGQKYIKSTHQHNQLWITEGFLCVFLPLKSLMVSSLNCLHKGALLIQ